MPSLPVMTTPGATEAVTPEQRADSIADKADDCCNRGGEWAKAIYDLAIKHVREAEVNALRRALVKAFGAVVANHKGVAYETGACDMQEEICESIRSLLPKEEGR